MLGYVQTNHGRHVFANPFEMDMWIEAMNDRFVGKGRMRTRGLGSDVGSLPGK
jgi:hypothetical protein